MIPHGNDVEEGIRQYLELLTKKMRKYATPVFVPNYEVTEFVSKADLFDYIESPDYMVTRDMPGICFAYEVIENAPNDYQIMFYFSDQQMLTAHFAAGMPNQSNPVWAPQNVKADMNSFEWYSRRGYIYLQNMMANQILKLKSGDADASITTMTAPVPGQAAVDDDFTAPLTVLLPFCLMLTYICMVYNMVFKIVIEKESKAKETMRIMGMTDLPYWLSWLVFYTVINTLVSTLAWGTLMFKVINYSVPFYLWIFFWLYGQAVFGQIIFLQSMFTRSKYAGIVSTVIYFCGVLLNSVVSNDDVTR